MLDSKRAANRDRALLMAGMLLISTSAFADTDCPEAGTSDDRIAYLAGRAQGLNQIIDSDLKSHNDRVEAMRQAFADDETWPGLIERWPRA